MEETGGGSDNNKPDSRHLKRAAGLVPVQAWVPKHRKAEAMTLLDALVDEGKMMVEKLKAVRRRERRAERLKEELDRIEHE